MSVPAVAGEEFRDDLRPAPSVSHSSASTALRRVLTPAELASLTTLSDARSAAAVAMTLGIIALAIAFGVAIWPSPWIALSVIVIGIEQHAMFILAHDAAHYRLFRSRTVNDIVGRSLGFAGGISM